jgi:hypothetical protein
MDPIMAGPANRLQVFQPVAAAMRAKFAVVDLQRRHAAAPGTSPPIVLEDLLAVLPVDGRYQTSERQAAIGVRVFRDQPLALICRTDEPAVRRSRLGTADVVSGESFGSPSGHFHPANNRLPFRRRALDIRNMTAELALALAPEGTVPARVR